MAPEAEEQLFLRAILRWVGANHPGQVARVTAAQQDTSTPSLWHITAQLTDLTQVHFACFNYPDEALICLRMEDR